MSRLLAIAVLVSALIAVHAQCTGQAWYTHKYRDPDSDAYLKIVAPANTPTATWNFVETNSRNLTITVNGGAAVSTSLVQEQDGQSLTLTINSYGTADEGGAAVSARYGAGASSGLSVLLGVVATAVATHYCSAGAGGAVLAGGMTGLATAVHAHDDHDLSSDCTTPNITIAIPNRYTVVMDLTAANIDSAKVACPPRAVYHAGSGCAYVRSTYQRVWSGGPGADCATLVDGTITMTSTAGEYISFNNGVPTQKWFLSSKNDFMSKTSYGTLMTASSTARANVTVWNPFSTRKFMPIEVRTIPNGAAASQYCKYAYVCVSGTCASTTDNSPTYNCAAYEYQASANLTSVCRLVNGAPEWSGYPFGPAYVCNTWCNSRSVDPANPATCSAALCQAPDCGVPYAGAPCPPNGIINAATRGAGNALNVIVTAVSTTVVLAVAGLMIV